MRLTRNIDEIEQTGVLELDLSWLSNNFQRALPRHARRCTATRLNRIKPRRRYAVLVCFLRQRCDGQRFALASNVLQQSYSPRFNDFALEFYSFVADNYAPFYSIPIECTDRDAPYVLDGLLYNESDLPLQEHYTDTHGYTEINFAAFAMLGRRFAPRIRGLHKQRIYRIGKTREYGTACSSA